MTTPDKTILRVPHEPPFHGAPRNAALFTAPHSVPIAGITMRCPWRCRTLERIRVREQAAEIAAAVGPVALEIIADFRARRWTVIAAYRKGTISGELAMARADEWHRIATAVSTLMHL